MTFFSWPTCGRGSRSVLLLAGLALIGGIGCATITLPPPEDQRAKNQFQKLAEPGNAEAQYQLALSYRYGSSGLAVNPQEALRWFKAAAGQGHVDAWLALADMEFQGGRREAGVAALEEAGQHGGAAAQLTVGTIFESGLAPTLPPNSERARFWYQRAATSSSAARQRLGSFAERGIAGQRDLVSALAWYLAAASSFDVQRLQGQLSRAEQQRAALLAKQRREGAQP